MITPTCHLQRLIKVYENNFLNRVDLFDEDILNYSGFLNLIKQKKAFKIRVGSARTTRTPKVCH